MSESNRLEDQFLIEKIMLLLEHKDRMSMSQVCKAWRSADIASSNVNKEVATPNILTADNYESFALWLSCRHQHIRHLDILHQDSISNNKIAAEALSHLTDSLEVLVLALYKSTRNRRGVPSPATLTWLPTFTNLKTFVLAPEWDLETDWKLQRSMPDLHTLVVAGGFVAFDGHDGPHTDQFPLNLHRLDVLSRASEGVLSTLTRLTQLKQLSFDMAAGDGAEVDAYIGTAFPFDDAAFAQALKKLTNLTSLALNNSLVADPRNALTLNAVRSLTALESLDIKTLFDSSNSLAVDSICNKLTGLTSLSLDAEMGMFELPPHLSKLHKLKQLNLPTSTVLFECPPKEVLQLLQHLNVLTLPMAIIDDYKDILMKVLPNLKNVQELTLGMCHEYWPDVISHVPWPGIDAIVSWVLEVFIDTLRDRALKPNLRVLSIAVTEGIFDIVLPAVEKVVGGTDYKLEVVDVGPDRKDCVVTLG